MAVTLQRLRGSRRKKIEKAVIEAGYTYQYTTQNYKKNLKVTQQPRIDTVRLANDMNIDRLLFTRNFTNNQGMPLYFAKKIINFLQNTQHINLKYNFCG